MAKVSMQDIANQVGTGRQGELAHRFMCGVYELQERLVTFINLWEQILTNIQSDNTMNICSKTM